MTPQEQYRKALERICSKTEGRPIFVGIYIIAREALQFAQPAPDEWRCYHCGKVFTDPVLAAEHFGEREISKPAPCERMLIAIGEAFEQYGIHRNFHNAASVKQLAQQRDAAQATIRELEQRVKKLETALRTVKYPQGRSFEEDLEQIRNIADRALESATPPPVCGTCGGTKTIAVKADGEWSGRAPCPECSKESS